MHVMLVVGEDCLSLVVAHATDEEVAKAQRLATRISRAIDTDAWVRVIVDNILGSQSQMQALLGGAFEDLENREEHLEHTRHRLQEAWNVLLEMLDDRHPPLKEGQILVDVSTGRIQ